MNIKANMDALLSEVPSHVKLIVVSKLQSLHHIREAYDAGQRRFGENRVQDLIAKQPLLPQDIEWHFIGHLQTNKVKSIAPFISVIQSVDSLKVLQDIDREAARNERIIDCMLQFYIASEETKFGLDLTEAENLLGSEEFRILKHIRITGLMGMSTNSKDVTLVKKEFMMLKFHFDTLSKKYFSNEPTFREISMGMSGDYLIAIEAGSTMVRIGSAIFR